MTASSVEFFPCRVQLMGLPRSTTTNVAANTSNRLGDRNVGSRPSLSKLQGVSRNLFGAPDRTEMKNLYHQEAERLRSYVLQRYNFDTKTSKPMNEQDEQQPTEKFNISQNTINSTDQPTQFPTLIEQELRQHEQRLQSEEYNLSRAASETTPPNMKTSNHTNRGLKVTRKCCEHSSSLSPAAERQKPYTRQAFLTESFNIRKNKNVKQCDAEINTLESSLKSHRNLEVLQLPQPIKAEQKSCNIKAEETDLFLSRNNGTLNGIDVSNSTSSCNDNCSKLSLQLVVSTKNLS